MELGKYLRFGACALAMAFCGPIHAAPSVVVSGSGAGGKTVTVTWDAPLYNVDGTPAAGLAGYKLYWGQASGAYGQNQAVPGASNTMMATFLASGLWFLAVTALDAQGNESVYSAEVQFVSP